tara:strand:+ start:52 stop:312 length:261 start_codon:yes stop_codon:yes gene_type:complete
LNHWASEGIIAARFNYSWQRYKALSDNGCLPAIGVILDNQEGLRGAMKAVATACHLVWIEDAGISGGRFSKTDRATQTYAKRQTAA